MDQHSWKTRRPLVVKEIVPDALCDEVLRHFKESPQLPRSYQGVVDESLRKCDFTVVPEPVADRVTQHIESVVRDHFGVESTPVDGQPVLIYRYGEGVGFVPHHDEVTEAEIERSKSNGQPVIGGDLTTVVFLNAADEYGGGSLYFDEPVSLDLRPPRGTLVAFPATRAFVHGVRPITFGERYTLLARRSVTGTV